MISVDNGIYILKVRFRKYIRVYQPMCDVVVKGMDCVVDDALLIVRSADYRG